MNIILFDIDGTLINSEFDDECFITTFKQIYNIDITNTNWDNYKDATESGIAIEILKKYLNKNPDFNEFNEMKKIINKNVELLKKAIIRYPDKIYKIPGAKNIINELKNKSDFIIGIATGCWKKTALTKLNGAKFDINEIELSHADNYISKLDIIKNAIDKIKFKYNIKEIKNIFYIGDREYDYKITKKINIEFIGVDYKKDGKLKCLGIKKIINDFQDKDKFYSFII